jgi:hypothetical protein
MCRLISTRDQIRIWISTAADWFLRRRFPRGRPQPTSRQYTNVTERPWRGQRACTRSGPRRAASTELFPDPAPSGPSSEGQATATHRRLGRRRNLSCGNASAATGPHPATHLTTGTNPTGTLARMGRLPAGTAEANDTTTLRPRR